MRRDERPYGSFKLVQAAAWIADMLAHGPARSSELLREAKESGIKEVTYYRARAAMGDVGHRRIAGGGGWETYLKGDR